MSMSVQAVAAGSRSGEGSTTATAMQNARSAVLNTHGECSRVSLLPRLRRVVPAVRVVSAEEQVPETGCLNRVNKHAVCCTAGVPFCPSWKEHGDSLSGAQDRHAIVASAGHRDSEDRQRGSVRTLDLGDCEELKLLPNALGRESSKRSYLS